MVSIVQGQLLLILVMTNRQRQEQAKLQKLPFPAWAQPTAQDQHVEKRESLEVVSICHRMSTCLAWGPLTVQDQLKMALKWVNLEAVLICIKTPTLSGTAGNNSSWFGDEAFQVGESGGSADLPQSAEISNVDGLNSPGSAFADFGDDQPARASEAPEATISSMGATNSPRTAHAEAGESGGSAHLPQDVNMPSLGVTDSPRSAQDGFEVGESGGSSHLHQDANPSGTAGNNSSWFGDEAFQVGESGGSADLPQSAEISNLDGLNSPGSACADFGDDQPARASETPEATIPSMGATNSPRSAHAEAGESGGSVHLPQDVNMPSLGATDSPRSAQDGFEVGESGGSSHLHQDANPSGTAGNNSSWFGDEAFQVGESGGSADLPQSAEISNVDGLNSPGSAFADFGDDQPARASETPEATISQHGHSQQPKNSTWLKRESLEVVPICHRMSTCLAWGPLTVQDQLKMALKWVNLEAVLICIKMPTLLARRATTALGSVTRLFKLESPEVALTFLKVQRSPM